MESEKRIAVEQAEKVTSQNLFLEIPISTKSAIAVADHLNEFVVKDFDEKKYDTANKETYSSLAENLDELICLENLQNERLPEKISVTMSRSQMEALRNLNNDTEGYSLHEKFAFKDALTEIEVAYNEKYRNETSSRSKILQFIGKMSK